MPGSPTQVRNRKRAAPSDKNTAYDDSPVSEIEPGALGERLQTVVWGLRGGEGACGSLERGVGVVWGVEE